MKKAKQDFCFPFYFQRYLSGTMGFTPEMHGAYLLAMIYQFQNGHFSEASINRVIEGKFDIIKHKYEIDEDGLYFNETMEEVIIDRKNFIETKRNNRLGKTKVSLPNNGSSSVVPLQGDGDGGGSIGVVKDDINYQEILDDLNEKAGRGFRSSSAKTRSLIKARMAEGFTVEDFKTVHDRKCDEWLKDDEWSKYLKPDTLYSNKFEGYLNQPKIEPEREIDYSRF